MNPEQTWKIGDVSVEVKSAKEPWADGVGDSAVVIASGLHGTLRGKLAQFWRNELEGGRQVIRRVSDQIRQSLWVEPARPLWMLVPITLAGDVQEYNICVA